MPSLIGIDVFSQAEYNPFKALSIRQLNGAYARIEPLSDETLSIGLGCMMDYEKLSKGQSDGLVARGTSYVSYFYEKDIYTLSRQDITSLNYLTYQTIVLLQRYQLRSN